jgi:excisionase family DNA binding protein
MEYMLIGEIAKLYGCSVDTIRRLVDAGDLPAVRITDDGWRRVEKRDVIAYAQRKNIRLDWTILEQ